MQIFQNMKSVEFEMKIMELLISINIRLPNKY